MTFLKKAIYGKLVEKVNVIDTSRFVLKTKHETYISYLQRKISDADKEVPSISRIVKKTDYHAKITEIESEIPSVSNLATNFVLTAVKNKILDVSNIGKKY